MKTFFELLPQVGKDEILRAARRRNFGDGTRIQGRERPLRRVCVITKGRVRFANVTLDGTEIDTVWLEPGQSFGEITSFAGRPPPHDAYAVGKVELGIVEWPVLQLLIETHPEIAETFLKAMASMLMDALEALDDLRSLPPLALVAKHLLLSTSADSPLITVNQSTLAARLGCSRATLSKALQKLQRARALKIGYRGIEVVDSRSLAKFARAVPGQFVGDA
jgi:CRP-like cAMP-binding protein